MNAIDSVYEFVVPLLPGWRVQVGKWRDDPEDDISRFAVIRPMGGTSAGLVRRPLFSLTLISNKQPDESNSIVFAAADAIIEASRVNAGSLVLIESGEPAYTNTSDGRHVVELAISTISI